MRLRIGNVFCEEGSSRGALGECSAEGDVVMVGHEERVTPILTVVRIRLRLILQRSLARLHMSMTISLFTMGTELLAELSDGGQ